MRIRALELERRYPEMWERVYVAVLSDALWQMKGLGVKATTHEIAERVSANAAFVATCEHHMYLRGLRAKKGR